MKSPFFQKLLSMLQQIAYILYALTLNAVCLTAENAELIALWGIRDELQGSFYNITTHCQVIFGITSLSSELSEGMWQGISSTHQGPFMKRLRCRANITPTQIPETTHVTLT